nr:odorant receptor 43a-like isoform X1 [Plodia interpunctella]
MLSNNVDLFLKPHMQFLKYLGLDIGMTTKPNKLYDLYQIFALCLQYSIPIFILVYLGIVWGDLDAMSMGLYVLFTQASTCLKMTALVVKRKSVVELLKMMNNHEFVAQTDDQHKILSVQYRKMRRLYLFLLTVVTFNCLEWAVIPLLNSQGPRAYPFVMWMPGNIDKSPDYELGYLYQLGFAFMGAYSFMTTDALSITMISFACAQLDIIKDKIQKIQSIGSLSVSQQAHKDICKENNTTLIQCLAQHQAIIKFILYLENFFNVTIFFQMSGSAAIVCIIAFRISVEPPNTFQFYSSVNYMLSMLAQLYFYCWSGNELTTRSQELRDELYQCPWYEQDRLFRRRFSFAMECMKKPIVLKAGHFITLSRPTFVAILRCSYSYFAVLNQANSQ